ncbi:MAG: primosomal protein N', partial [Sideroxyarcus sp.]|nr:primosomal protein N' [Sideroxyarcus sp.]
MPIVRVALDIPLPTLFDYTVEEGIAVAIGRRVIVPFGRRQLVGVVMECVAATEMAPERVKPVMQVLHDSAPLSAELLGLLRFCSDYYRYPIGQTVLSALPTRLRSDKPVITKLILSYRLTASGVALDLGVFPKRKVVQRRILAKLAEQPCNLAQLKSLSATAGAQLKALVAEGWVESVASTRSTLLNPLPQAGEEANEKSHIFNGAHTLTG